jgi:muramidase (phage lysozyme)
MNSLIDATALVPTPKDNTRYSTKDLEDQVHNADLPELLGVLAIPEVEEHLPGVRGLATKYQKKQSLPLAALTTGVIETFREMQDLNEKFANFEDEGIHLLKRVAKWGVHRIVKYVFKLAFKMMVKFARWIFKKVIVQGLKALVEWVVRPILMEALGFIGVNPELWPFIAIAGGVAGIGFAGWKMFFDKPDTSKTSSVSQNADDFLGPDTYEAVTGEVRGATTEPGIEAETHYDVQAEAAARATSSMYQARDLVGQGAAAPEPAGGAAASTLGALISRGEGTYTSVNFGAAQGYRAGNVDLPNMTVSEVMQHQQARDFNAAGRYQIIGPTLAAAVKALKLTGNEKFDQTTQDLIFTQYLLGIKRQAIGAYISGKSNDIQQAMLEASQEWASVAAPPGVRTQSGAISDGTISYYSGVANNKASITSTEMAQALNSARTTHSALVPPTQLTTTQSVPNNKVRQTAAVTPATQQTTMASTGSTSQSSGGVVNPPSAEKNYIRGAKGALIAVS